VPKDPLKAIEAYKKGADRGDWQAAQAIAHMYASGEGVERNSALSEEWFSRSVRLKHESLGRRDYFLRR
jgi:TPR repeat protein